MQCRKKKQESSGLPCGNRAKLDGWCLKHYPVRARSRVESPVWSPVPAPDTAALCAEIKKLQDEVKATQALVRSGGAQLQTAIATQSERTRNAVHAAGELVVDTIHCAFQFVMGRQAVAVGRRARPSIKSEAAVTVTRARERHLERTVARVHRGRDARMLMMRRLHP